VRHTDPVFIPTDESAVGNDPVNDSVAWQLIEPGANHSGRVKVLPIDEAKSPRGMPCVVTVSSRTAF